jgi:predicted ribosomally synthesized peptide with nif11-like leader
MSPARAFLDRVRTDPALAEQVQAIAERHAAVDRLVALGDEHGFSFDADELAATLRSGAGGLELAEDDLERVQGGITAVLNGLVQDSPSDGSSTTTTTTTKVRTFLCPTDP